MSKYMQVWKKFIPVSMVTLGNSRLWWKTKNIGQEVVRIAKQIEIEPGKGVAAIP